MNKESITKSDKRETSTIRVMVKEAKAAEGSGPLKNMTVCIQYSVISLWRNHKTDETKKTGTSIPPKKATASFPDNFTIRIKLIIIGIKRKKTGV